MHDQIDEKGEAIVLLGTRYDESQSRNRNMKKHEVEGSRLSPHNSSPNTMTYSPIKELHLEDVWFVINSIESPWGFDNSILYKIYSDASSDDYECPTVVTNKDHKSLPSWYVSLNTLFYKIKKNRIKWKIKRTCAIG